MNIFDNPKDAALLTACPLLPVPIYGTLPELTAGACRYLVARDGIYIEARTATMHAIGQVSRSQALPFGGLAPRLQLTGGKVPTTMIEEAKRRASAASPLEWAGAVVYRDGAYELVEPQQSATACAVRYSTAELDSNALVMDLHSHGELQAYFSHTDDSDDASTPTVAFIAGVFGSLSSGCTATWRVIVNGWAFNLDMTHCKPLI